jgi:hypothetical protein
MHNADFDRGASGIRQGGTVGTRKERVASDNEGAKS